MDLCLVEQPNYVETLKGFSTRRPEGWKAKSLIECSKRQAKSDQKNLRYKQKRPSDVELGDYMEAVANDEKVDLEFPPIAINGRTVSHAVQFECCEQIRKNNYWSGRLNIVKVC